jgi:hypothetical protein
MLLSHKHGGLESGKPVAVVLLTSHVEDMDDTDSSVVGAIMPSAVLGAGSV